MAWVAFVLWVSSRICSVWRDVVVCGVIPFASNGFDGKGLTLDRRALWHGIMLLSRRIVVLVRSPFRHHIVAAFPGPSSSVSQSLQLLQWSLCASACVGCSSVGRVITVSVGWFSW